MTGSGSATYTNKSTATFVHKNKNSYKFTLARDRASLRLKQRREMENRVAKQKLETKPGTV